MKKLPVLYAVLAAACYGISIPISKLLLVNMPPVLMASMLYFGAGFGMGAVGLLGKERSKRQEAGLAKKDLPFVIAMVILDIAAPILLMIGLSTTNPATASLLNNFEIVATSVIALVVFKEAVGRRTWWAVVLITTASAILSVGDISTLSFTPGAVLVLLACLCWGIENNCTRMLSLKNPKQIVVIKGIGSGLGSLIIAFLTHSFSRSTTYIIFALILGFVAYGLSIYFYILAQRSLGASRTSAFYAVAPFIGVGLSFIIFREAPSPSFGIAVAIMIAGAYLAAFDRHKHQHEHDILVHEHRHNHNDGHHAHAHDPPVAHEHSHNHEHAKLIHEHEHTPDLHHTHNH